MAHVSSLFKIRVAWTGRDLRKHHFDLHHQLRLRRTIARVFRMNTPSDGVMATHGTAIGRAVAAYFNRGIVKAQSNKRFVDPRPT